jgi:hypothetical protein
VISPGFQVCCFHKWLALCRYSSGTLNVVNACKLLGIKKIVMSSSPSTRFDGKDINGKGLATNPLYRLT